MKFAALLAPLLALAGPALAAPYTFTPLIVPESAFEANGRDLGTAVSTTFEARGLNDAGQVAGNVSRTLVTSSGNKVTFRVNAIYDNGAFRVGRLVSPSISERVTGINDAGVLAGVVFNGRFASPFTREFEQGVATFQVPGTIFGAVANGINDQGQVVGTSSTGSLGQPPDSEGFVRGADAGIVVFDVPGARVTTANGINDAGQIVGSYSLPGNESSRQGYFRAGGTFSTLNVPGAASTELLAVNDAGEIAGEYRTSAGTLRGFLYSGGIFSDLPGSDSTAFLPVALNDAGQLLGTFGGTGMSYLATPQATPQPVPEPASAALLGAGLVLLGGRLRQRPRPRG